MPAAPDDEPATATDRRTRAPTPADEDASPREFPSHLLARGAVFRRRHRLYGPIALYGGRIDPGKGCEELIEYFSSYVKDGGDATLALMGVKLMALPEEPFIRFAGLLSDRERLQALEAATVVVCPSPYESLSLLALEALSVGTPVLVNARSAVLVEHCVRSNGGLYYADRDEFVECLKLLVGDARLRAALGRNGRDYVRRNYRWDVVLGKVRADLREDQERPVDSRRLDVDLSSSALAGVSGRPATPARRLDGARLRPARRRCRSAVALAPRPDVVPLDHLVQRRRLDVQQLGGALLHAARRLERRLDQPLLEVGDDVLERNAFGRHDELRHAGSSAPCARDRESARRRCAARTSARRRAR